MKNIVTEKREVLVSATQAETTFSILANGKAFKTLIDGLYANKIRAVIRELSTNAYDSHKESGQTRSFKVQAPTHLEPTFRVRDYGTSMTEEEIMGLYTTVFASSKEDTNEQVGKLGLGSKSPFAYTDQFTVASYQKGIKQIFNAYLGEDGVPHLVKFGTVTTEEDDGFEVSLQVKSEDVRTFGDEIEVVSYGFKEMFEVVGDPSIVSGLSHVDTALEGNGWVIFKDRSMYDAKLLPSRAYARQGCVLYPLDIAPLPNSKKYAAFTNAFCIVDFPIGTVDIAASREALSYDKTTIANIEARLDQVIEEVTEATKIVVNDSIDNLLDAKKKAKEIYSDRVKSEFLRKLSNDRFTWRGENKSLSPIMFSRNRLKDNNFSNYTAPVYEGHFSATVLNSDDVTGSGAKVSDLLTNHINLGSGSSKTVFYFDDMTKRTSLSRFRYHFCENFDTTDTDHNVVWFRYTDIDLVKRFLRRCGWPKNVFFVQNLPMPPRSKAGSSKIKTKFERISIRHSGYVDYSKVSTHLDFDKEPEGFYFFLNRNDAVSNPFVEESDREYLSRYSVDSMLKYFNKMKLFKDKPIIGLRPPYNKAILEQEGWKNIFDYIVEKVDYKGSNLMKSYKYMQKFDSYEFKLRDTINLLSLHTPKDVEIPEGFAELVDMFKKGALEITYSYKSNVRDFEYSLDKAYSLATMKHDLPPGFDKKVGDDYPNMIEQLNEAMTRDYPMLKYITGGRKEDAKRVIEYIDMCHKERNITCS